MTSSGDISSTSDFVRPRKVKKRPYLKYESVLKNKSKRKCEVDAMQAQGDEVPAKRSVRSIQLCAGFKWNLQALTYAADAVESGGKSPVSALNELGLRVTYTVLRQGGPAHCPSFTVAVTVADLTFEGCGHSKREARAAAARACLAAMVARSPRDQDFTSDDLPRPSDFQTMVPNVSPPGEILQPDSNTQQSASSSISHHVQAPPLFGAAVATAHKSPINILYEKYPAVSFLCTYGDGTPLEADVVPVQLSHSMRFKVVCQIKDETFEGYGSSKKLAKLAAARSAFGALGTLPAGPPLDQDYAFEPRALQDHLADTIAKLVNEKFNELMKNDIVHSKRKVLAGIVMTIDNKVEGAKVVAVTTGTKCVSGDRISVSGLAVNDCHAEVAARRCLQRYLYAQLLAYANQPDPRRPLVGSDVEPAAGGGYRLRPDRRLHLYVSTAPCGDARIFSPHDHDARPDPHPNRLARGQLRTKIESGEGTIPVKNCNNLIQTWDGVLQGERLLTMSCSDKVARWCVVGLQGALLSQLMHPVYLHSLVLGSLLHPHHMYRAICGRIEKYIECLPPPYRLQRPLLARAASADVRTPARAPTHSVCWTATSPLPEVINATTGKLENGQPSLLCKQSMFARWLYLVKRLPLLPQETEQGMKPTQLPENLDSLPYYEAKLICRAYQESKSRLISSFESASLGRWVKKPIEQDTFLCELLNADESALFA